jgi:hypothetical protein
MGHYLAYNLVANSEIEILGASPISQAGDQLPDINIYFAAAEIHADATSNGPYRRHGERLLFEAPNVARYLCIGGKQLAIAAYLNADPNWVKGLLVATALPTLLWQRGGFVLHASAVVLPKQHNAVALAGPSGVGKSTIIAQLVQRNACVVGDDTLNLTITPEGPQVAGLPGVYFTGEARDADRFSVAVPPDQIAKTAPLAAIVVLQQVDALNGSPIMRLHGAEAFEAVLQNRHRPRVPAVLGLEMQIFRFCTLLCTTTPVYIWRRRRGSSEISDEEFGAVNRLMQIRNK